MSLERPTYLLTVMAAPHAASHGSRRSRGAPSAGRDKNPTTMRSAGRRLLAQALGPASKELSVPGGQTAALASSQQLRYMAGGHSGPTPETPLSKIMPPLVALPRQVVGTALSLTGKLLVAAASSGAVKSTVTSFADNLLLTEQFVKLTELDVSYWVYWLATSGYADAAGYKRFAEAAMSTMPSMEPGQVTQLLVGFHKANVYDKALFGVAGSHISANFTKYETEQLLQILGVFNDFGHYDKDVYDDIGDSITYANHYLAPIKAPVQEVIKALATYAKFGHERADLFVTLARGISELALGKLDSSDRKAAVVHALNAFKRFNFYPEQVDALLYYTETQSELFSSDELATAAAIKSAIESQSGGKLAVYHTNDQEDATHWYSHHAHHAPAHHELYVFREALVPKSYSPMGFRPNNKD